MSEDTIFDLAFLFLDWLTYGFAPWFIAAMCLFWLPRLTLSLGSIFLIYWFYWTSTLDDNISELMQTEISMSIAEIQSDQNVAISNRENCGWFNASCQVYKAINKLLEGGIIIMEDGTKIANLSSQIVAMNPYSGSALERIYSGPALERIKKELRSELDQFSDTELEEIKQNFTRLIKNLQEMEGQGKTDAEIIAYLENEVGFSILELQAAKDIFGL